MPVDSRFEVSDLALAISKHQLQCELHDARIAAGRGDHAERRSRREIVYGLTEFRSIREIEEFRAEIEGDSLVDGEASQYSQIEIPL